MDGNTQHNHNTGAARALEKFFPLLFLALAIIAYLPAINGGFIWDDDFHVLKNPHLVGIDGLRRIWFTTESQQYYPLVYTSFWVEHQIWGSATTGYHLVNIFLHAFNASMITLIFRRLKIPGGLAAGLIFALHPVHAESVAWITERKNVLSAAFYLASMHAYLGHVETKSKKGYAISLVFFALALLSKTITSTLAVVLLLLHWLKKEPIGKKEVVKIAPFFAIGMAFGLLTIWWEMYFVGAKGAGFDLPIVERLLLPGRAVFFYLYKLIVPAKLTFIYPRWELDVASIAQWAYGFFALGLGAILLIAHKSIGRSPFAAFAFFAVSLFPALGFFNVYPFRYSFVADHFQYIASIGPIGLFAGIGAWAIKDKRAKSVLLAIIAIALGALTFKQSYIYKNLDALWTDTISKNPGAWMAYVNLGNVYRERGDYARALELFAKALEINPNVSEAYISMGNVYLKAGDASTALERFNEAARVNPSNEMAYYNIGNLYTSTGDTGTANSYYQKAISINPRSAVAHYNLANNLMGIGLGNEAIGHYEVAVKLMPYDHDLRINYGIALAKSGRRDIAKEQFEEALRIMPGSEMAQRNLAILAGR